jgi:hypothetical protein
MAMSRGLLADLSIALRSSLIGLAVKKGKRGVGMFSGGLLFMWSGFGEKCMPVFSCYYGKVLRSNEPGVDGAAEKILFWERESRKI